MSIRSTEEFPDEYGFHLYCSSDTKTFIVLSWGTSAIYNTKYKVYIPDGYIALVTFLRYKWVMQTRLNNDEQEFRMSRYICKNKYEESNWGTDPIEIATNAFLRNGLAMPKTRKGISFFAIREAQKKIKECFGIIPTISKKKQEETTKPAPVVKKKKVRSSDNEEEFKVEPKKPKTMEQKVTSALNTILDEKNGYKQIQGAINALFSDD